jgi:hypothetical protein
MLSQTSSLRRVFIACYDATLRRVFFDNIGPPWPKHPCTDKSSEFNTGVSNDASEEWPLVECIEVKAENENILCLSSKILDEHLFVYIRSDAFGDVSKAAQNLSQSYIQARLRPNGRFDLALLTPALRPMLITGYSTARDAEAGKS